MGFVSLSQGCTVSEIEPWSGSGEVPEDWLPADGRTLPVSISASFLHATGGEYGGDGYRAVALPDITDSSGDATHIICIKGKLPSTSEKEGLRSAIYKAMVESSVCEVGSTMDYPEDAEVPENWLRQEGQTIDRGEYPLLYRSLANDGELPDEEDTIICADGE